MWFYLKNKTHKISLSFQKKKKRTTCTLPFFFFGLRVSDPLLYVIHIHLLSPAKTSIASRVNDLFEGFRGELRLRLHEGGPRRVYSSRIPTRLHVILNSLWWLRTREDPCVLERLVKRVLGGYRRTVQGRPGTVLNRVPM